MRRAPVLIVLLAALPSAGCVAVAAGAAGYGAVKYATNEQARDYPASLASTWAAAVETLRGMGYAVPEGIAPGPTEGRIAIDDIRVDVAKYSDTRSRVEVRVGTFDSEDHRRRATILLDGVGKRVGDR